MKRIINVYVTTFCLLTTSLFANADNNITTGTGGFYIGIDFISSSNTFKFGGDFSSEANDDSSGFKLKLGFESNDHWRVQGYILRETYDIPVFDSINDTSLEVGVDLIKAFEVTPKVLPFLQIGAGVGSIDATTVNNGYVNAVSLKAGGGIMFQINKTFEIIGGIDYQVRVWDDIDFSGPILKTTEYSTKVYTGLNIHF